MPYAANGIFTPLITFVPNTEATAEDQNAQDLDFANGFSNVMTRAGLAPATGPQNMGGYKVVGVATGVDPTDAVNVSQLGNNALLVGTVIDYAGNALPANYLFCNGAAISRAAYPVLFTIIGTVYGSGDGTTTFNIPDARGRVAASVDPSGTRLTSFSMTPDGMSLGATGGTEGVTLTTNQLAAHIHTNSLTDPGHTHTYAQPAAPTNVFTAGATGSAIASSPSGNTGSSTTGITITNASAGGGTAHLNVQPTILFSKIIKIQ